jgi:hypothetical protein
MMNRRALFLMVFVVAASLVLWLQGDDVLFGSWPAKILGGRSGTDDAVGGEAFTGAKDEEAAKKETNNGVPMPYASESVMGYSPAVFQEGGRSNPPPPAKDPKLYGTPPPDSQRFATLLGERSRDNLWLACQTRRASCKDPLQKIK